MRSAAVGAKFLEPIPDRSVERCPNRAINVVGHSALAVGRNVVAELVVYRAAHVHAVLRVALKLERDDAVENLVPALGVVRETKRRSKWRAVAEEALLEQRPQFIGFRRLDLRNSAGRMLHEVAADIVVPVADVVLEKEPRVLDRCARHAGLLRAAFE